MSCSMHVSNRELYKYCEVSLYSPDLVTLNVVSPHDSSYNKLTLQMNKLWLYSIIINLFA